MKIIIVGIVTLFGVIGLVGILGFLVPEKKTASAEYIYNQSSAVVWLKMRDISGQSSWRNQIDSIEILDSAIGKEDWIENLKSGASVKLRTTTYKEGQLWGIETYDSPMVVKWVGEVDSKDKQKTLVKFQYESSIANPYFRILALSFLNLESMIQLYASELKSELDKNI
ncbi:MAG: hypothetical protein O9264_09810 [Leptospira sp.]|nr:hypothetical protein [Leptospira sp.]